MAALKKTIWMGASEEGYTELVAEFLDSIRHYQIIGIYELAGRCTVIWYYDDSKMPIRRRDGRSED